MQIVRKSDRLTLTPEPDVKIYEYETDDAFLSGAVAEIDGRYPDRGFCVNERLKELVYVIAGQGLLVFRNKSVPFEAGDTLFIDHGEAFAWEGQMTLYIATAPKFDPAQHKEID